MAEEIKEDVSKKATVELITEMTNLDKQIDLLLLKYEKIRLELIKRYQFLEDTEEFKPKAKK